MLAGCAEQQDPNSLGEEYPNIAGIVIEEGANIRQSPEFTNPDDSRRGLGILVTEITQSQIDAFSDSDDVVAGQAVIETPNGVRSYEDRNGRWFGIKASDLVHDACTTDKDVNPFDDNAFDRIESARLECDRVLQDFGDLETVWVNEDRAEPISTNN